MMSHINMSACQVREMISMLTQPMYVSFLCSATALIFVLDWMR